MARLNKAYFTSNGTWTAPAGVTEVLLIGAGGGGGGGAAYHIGGTNGGGGGGGSIQQMAIVNVTPNTGYSVTIGAGGTGGSPPAAGLPGASTTFGSLFSAIGGSGGPEGLTAANGNRAHHFSNGSGSVSFDILIQTSVAACGGATVVPTANGPDGQKNWSGNGSYSGGTGGTSVSGTSGGGGGGAGPQGNGANGGNAVTSGTPNAGANASANSGAGGGGGGGTAAGGAAGGAGGNGGSGYLYVIWVD